MARRTASSLSATATGSVTDEDRIDIASFELDVRDGRESLRAGDFARAESTLRQGLALWRGRALEDLPGHSFEDERARLTELPHHRRSERLGRQLQRAVRGRVPRFCRRGRVPTRYVPARRGDGAGRGTGRAN
ncbi:BTAD domain-containing putative transcriptional regulator [Streptomyces sp. NPDC088747]|uniref:BTAD domain-containing putative transcriptional regulator n=1 Tax=Streptomyces sp. NPDC088747 TaxID=3365886 RepID=UPI0037F9FBC7